MSVALFVGVVVYSSLKMTAHAQGTLENPRFENPGLPLSPNNYFVPTAAAIPGWTAYVGGVPVSSIVYNDVNLGAPAFSLHGMDSPLKPIQGNYSVILQGSKIFGGSSAAVGQTRPIPSTSMSLRFYGSMDMEVTFNGNPLSLILLNKELNYDNLVADISMFAGQTGEIRFTSNLSASHLLYLDNIRLSTLPIPEPGALTLLAFGLFGLGWRAHRTHQALFTRTQTTLQ